MIGRKSNPPVRAMLQFVQLPFCHTADTNFDVPIALKPSLNSACQENRTTQFMDSCGDGNLRYLPMYLVADSRLSACFILWIIPGTIVLNGLA